MAPAVMKEIEVECPECCGGLVFVPDGCGSCENSGSLVANQVGWRSPTTGNLFRPGQGSQKDWAGDGFEPVYVLVPGGRGRR